MRAWLDWEADVTGQVNTAQSALTEVAEAGDSVQGRSSSVELEESSELGSEHCLSSSPAQYKKIFE